MRRRFDTIENERRVAERRKRRVSFVLHERRSGFDRRMSMSEGGTVGLTSVLLGLRDRPRLLWVMLVTVNALNMVDFVLTLNVLAMGGGEANPILASLFSADPLYAGVFKVLLVLSATLLVWRCRRFRRALEAALIMVGLFTAVFVYHIAGLLVYN